MKAILALSILIVCLFPASAQQKSDSRKQQNPATLPTQQSTYTVEPKPNLSPAEPTVGSQTTQPNTGQKQSNTEPESKPWMTHGEWVNSILTLAYVLVSLGMLFVINRQASLMEQQAESSTVQFEKQLTQLSQQVTALQDVAIASKNSADAAKVSADGLRIAERPWIMVTLRDNLEDGKFRIKSDGKAENLMYFEWFLTNQGKTLAFVREIIANFEVMAADKVDEVMKSPPPVDAKALRPDTFMVAPGTPHECPGIEMTPYWTESERIAVMKKESFLVAYGVVKYTDAFGDEIHHTPFLGIYIFIDFYKGGEFRRMYHREYNKYT